MTTPECPQCHSSMEPLGKLPAVGVRPLVRVFICRPCNRVESETQLTTAPALQPAVDRREILRA